jgi:AmiR/NasT family two-component response regulator
VKSNFLPENNNGHTSPSWTNLRILLAEDDAIEALGIQSILEGLGHTVVATARNGEEALMLAGRVDPDLIVLDIRMPLLNGLEVARSILKKQSIPIIILTGYPEEAYIDGASELGIFGFRTKPVRAVDLKPEITITMDRFYERELLKEKISELAQWRETRRIVDKAKWILMEKHAISEEVAYKCLRRHCRNHGLRIADIASVVLENGDIPLSKGESLTGHGTYDDSGDQGGERVGMN